MSPSGKLQAYFLELVSVSEKLTKNFKAQFCHLHSFSSWHITSTRTISVNKFDEGVKDIHVELNLEHIFSK